MLASPINLKLPCSKTITTQYGGKWTNIILSSYVAFQNIFLNKYVW